MRTSLAVVLAAGEGKRMKSRRPKVLHEIGRLPMIAHVLKAAEKGGATATAVVIGTQADAVRAFIKTTAPGATVHEQKERLGTAHAVLAARSAIAEGADDVIVLYGDTPMVTAKTLGRVRKAIAAGSDIVLVGFRPVDPTGYGRLLVEKGRVVAIREEKDATAAEREIGFVWGGIMGFRGPGLLPLLKKIGKSNAQGEFYLTDAVALAGEAGQKVTAFEVDADEVAGVNDRIQLAHVEDIFQRRMRKAAMQGGATMTAPSTVWFSHDTTMGRDVLIEPNVVFGPGVRVADNVTIRAFSHIEGATISSGAIVGPFARLRPGARIGESAHIGNFVEIKAAEVEEGAKVNHLAYIGDARVGAKSNIGAGTITCNYDGVAKHHTDIGKNAFIGSNSALVAPVKIGDGAYVGSGSVITEDVPAGALAIGRGRQVNKPGRAAKKQKKK